MINQPKALRFDKLSNLKDELCQAERQVCDLVGIDQSREVVMGAIRSYCYSRYDLGRALRQYKTHYKAHHGWVAAAKIIGDALDYDERTVHRILEDYERASRLPSIIIEAMQAQNLDPAAHKNAPLVEHLLQMGEPKTREGAAKVVAGAVKEHLSQKKRSGKQEPRKVEVEEFAVKIVKLFEDRYSSTSAEDRDQEIRYVLERVVNTLRAPIMQLRQFPRPALVPKPEKKNAA